MEREPTGRDRHLDERRARPARRLGGFDPAGTTPVAAVNDTRPRLCDAGLFVRPVRPGGDGRPAAVLPRAARRAPGVLRRELGHLRTVAVLRHLARAGDQRRDLRRVGGNPARRNGSGAAQRRPGSRSAAASHAVPRELRQPDLRRRPPVHFGTVPPEVGRQARRPDSRAGQRAARRAAATRNLRPDPGLRRHRRRLGGVRIAGSTGRSGARGAGHGQRGQPRPAG